MNNTQRRLLCGLPIAIHLLHLMSKNLKSRMLKAYDGKMCDTDVADTKGILHLIQSIRKDGYPYAQPFTARQSA